MHPALHEAFGNVCQEALAAGRPVICLDIGGPASQVTPETGFAAPATTPGGSGGGDGLLSGQGRRESGAAGDMSAKARVRVREKFSMRIMGSAIESFYHQALCNTR